MTLARTLLIVPRSGLEAPLERDLVPIAEVAAPDLREAIPGDHVEELGPTSTGQPPTSSPRTRSSPHADDARVASIGPRPMRVATAASYHVFLGHLPETAAEDAHRHPSETSWPSSGKRAADRAGKGAIGTTARRPGSPTDRQPGPLSPYGRPVTG